MESEKPVIDFARVRTFTWVIGVGSPAGARRGRAIIGRTRRRSWTINIGRQLRAQNGRKCDRGSATAIGPRTTAGESPPPPSRRTPLDNRSTSRGGCVRETAGSGRVSGAVATAVVILRNDGRAVAHLSKSRRAARRRDAIANRMLGVGDHRPAIGRWRSAHLMSALTRL